MNNLQQEIIIKDFRQQVSEILVKWGMGTKQVAILEIVRAHERALEAVRLATRREIAEELSKLPYHTEKALYGTGLPEKLVTYTSRITDLKNKLKEEKKR